MTVVPAELRSSMKGGGAPSVMIRGALLMPKWCAGSWVVDMLFTHWAMQRLDKAEDPFGWTMSGAMAVSLLSPPANIMGLETTIVNILKMPASFVQVNANVLKFDLNFYR